MVLMAPPSRVITISPSGSSTSGTIPGMTTGPSHCTMAGSPIPRRRISRNPSATRMIP